MTRVLITDPLVGQHLIEQRRNDGVDTMDEVWEGVYRVVPAGSARHGIVQARALDFLSGWKRANASPLIVAGPVNIGRSDDYRVPDVAVLADDPGDDVYVSTAAMVVEVRSLDDDTYRKFPFYLAAGVQEILVLDPSKRLVELWCRGERDYVRGTRSEVLMLEGLEDLLSHLVG